LRQSGLPSASFFRRSRDTVSLRSVT
jgi:hypothetical protein